MTAGRRAAEHGHSHGLIDRSILRSRQGIRAVAMSLLILGVAAGAQLIIFLTANSIALLADLIHNFGDAATSRAPLWWPRDYRSRPADRPP